MVTFSRADLLAAIHRVSRKCDRVELYFDVESCFARILVMTAELSAVSPSELEAISIACRDFLPRDISIDVITVNVSTAVPPHSEARLRHDASDTLTGQRSA